jgi:hypothetical protein
MKIEAFTDKNAIIIFLNLFVNKGILVINIRRMTKSSKKIISKIFSIKKGTRKRVKVIIIFDMGCNRVIIFVVGK